MFLAGSRFVFFLAFLAGTLVMGGALYLQYGSGLKPCSLCLVQRFFLLGFCLVNLVAYVHGPQRLGLRCYSIASTLLALGGAASALRQMKLQLLPPEQLMFCQPDLTCTWHDLTPAELFSMIYQGGEDCTHIHWSVFDLSAPELSLLAFIGLLVLSIFQIFRTVHGDKLPPGCDAV
jgi:disulfide bond formation protein DsbB